MLTKLTPSLVACTLLCLLPGPAHGQILSKWGHPVITLGLTPYEATSTGWGNYPGSNGFIPGYGYYPGPFASRYPWLDGPGTPFDRRKIVPIVPEAAAETPPAGAALIIVKLPAEVELRFNGSLTSQGGSYRRFVTPTLPSDAESLYTLDARWFLKDLDLSRTEEIKVRPNGVFTVDFLNADGWKGKRLEALPVPRPMR